MSDATDFAAALSRIDQLMQAGRLDEADTWCRDLVQRAPQYANGWVRLGLVSSWRGDYAAAEEAFRRVIAIQPNEARIWSELSTAVCKQGRGAEAEQLARQAVALEPGNAAHWSVLGNALAADYRWTEAAGALQQSLALQPQDAAVWNNYGSAQLKLGQMQIAETAFQRSLAAAPGNVGASSNYAFLLCQLGRRDEASQVLEATIVRDPRVSRAWSLLGNVWQEMAEWGLAEAAYRRALALSPQDWGVQFQLGRALRSKRCYTQAEQAVSDLLTREPRNADALALLGEILSTQGRSHESMPLLRRAAEIAPGDDRHGRLLTVMQYDEAVTPEQILVDHQDWNAACARPFKPAVAAQVRPKADHDKLRIGLVSGDFGRHPTGYLVLPAVEHLDRDSCSVVCYSDRTQEDEYTARFRAAASEWRVTYGQTDERVAAQIRKDKIDVLIDLMGHNGQRMLMFARKPAPMQVTWFGYVGTTGLATMDYLLADRFHVRPGEEAWYRERVLRMPHDYACYGAPADAPAVGPLPALSTGRITFGCFNNCTKYSPRMMEAWATILGSMPSSRLLLKAGPLDDAGVRQRWRDWFAARGFNEDRILLEGWSPPAELLGCYDRVDVGLDTQPYSGGLTTCEALWMGIPVITFPGKTFAGRHSTSHMSNAGYEQFVAADLAGYIELAVEWAQEVNELARLRSEMRARVAKSPLCDAQQFARDLLKLLREAHQSLAATKSAFL
jgi:protein O-GlcNAc transferase